MTVIDANVVITALIGSDDELSAIAAQAVANAHILHDPAHFVSEVLGAVRWHAVGKRITWDDAESAFFSLVDLGAVQHAPTADDISRAWELRHNVTPQDALYVALAERLGDSLITGDHKLYRSKQVRCAITMPLLRYSGL